MRDLPSPAAQPGIGHLGRWTFAPLELLTEGARLGPVFQIRLWRPVVVGYRPEWTRAVLGDLDTFRSRGSLSDLTPYLAAGVVHADVPEHADRRAQLNPHFHRRAVTGYGAALRRTARTLAPVGAFEAVTWAGTVVRHMLNDVFFAGALPDALLADFLRPLHRRPPAPMLPRPRLFRRIDAATRRVLADPPAGTISAALADQPTAVEDIRVGLAAGYDTTAHTLAWALWHLSVRPDLWAGDTPPGVIDEVLRLYPAGWVGSRVCRWATRVGDVDLPAGTMVMYSPYLTHRDPQLWDDPGEFRPERFAAGRPAWAFLPFAAGARTCLGAQLARAMLGAAIPAVTSRGLHRLHGSGAVATSISLRPAGPLWLSTGAPGERAPGLR